MRSRSVSAPATAFWSDDWHAHRAERAAGLSHVASRFRQNAADKVRFVLAGDGPLRAETEALSQRLGLNDLVVFTGSVARAAAVALPAFDVFFQPSLRE